MAIVNNFEGNTPGAQGPEDMMVRVAADREGE